MRVHVFFGSQNIVETILAVEQALRQGTHVNRKKLMHFLLGTNTKPTQVHRANSLSKYNWIHSVNSTQKLGENLVDITNGRWF